MGDGGGGWRGNGAPALAQNWTCEHNLDLYPIWGEVPAATYVFTQDELPNLPSEDPLSSLGPSLSSAGSRAMPHFQKLLANLQVRLLSPHSYHTDPSMSDTVRHEHVLTSVL